jgi:sensor histidine kinase YesM
VNKNLIVVLYFALVALSFVCLVLIVIFAPAYLDKAMQNSISLLGIASTAVVTIYMLGKQNATLEEVKTQTNGTNTTLREQNAALHAQVLELTRAASPTSS